MNPKDKQPQKLDVSTTACTQLSDTALLEELRRRIERTNQTVGELTTLNDELRAVNKKLEESEALKSHFISNITNEIINPFTSILGLSRAILSVDKESWKKVVSMVALIHSEAFSLDFQFRNIFFAAKVEAGEEVPEVVSVDIQALVDGIIESFRYELRKRQVEVKVHNRLPKDDTKEGNFAFNTDPIYLKLVLANLLSNALNFSKKESSVDVTLEMAGEELRITVQDYGAGIAPDRLSRIFDRFTRGNDTINSVTRGHGLGLSVSKAVIDLLGGRIEVESQLGEGSKFTVVVPASTLPSDGYAPEANEIFFDDEETF